MRRQRAAALLKSIVAIAIVTACIAAAVWAVLRYLRPAATVTDVVEAPVVQAFYATGTLLPEREYSIRSATAGIVTQVLVDKGDRVTKGQRLAVVVDDALVFRFDQATAERNQKTKMADPKSSPALEELNKRIASAEELIAIAGRERDRLLSAGRAASQSEVDRALDRVRQLEGERDAFQAQLKKMAIDLQKDLEVAQAALKIAQWNIDQQTLISPIDGVVLDRGVSKGTRVAVNDRLTVVADVLPASLIMRAAVDEEDKTMLELEQVVRVSLYAYPGRTFEGRVKKIYDKADPDRRTFEVDVAMTDPDKAFAAGMTGELAFVVASVDRGTVIPSQAVQAGSVFFLRDGVVHRSEVIPAEKATGAPEGTILSVRQLATTALDKPTLDRLDQDGQVVLGLRSVERIQVLGGLRPTDKVVITPADPLRPGQHLPQPTYMKPDAAAGLNKPKEEKAFSAFR